MGFFDSISTVLTSAASSSANFEAVKDSAPNQIGVYVMSLNGTVMYVGRAVENRPNQSSSGLRKRLQEHWRGATAGKPELAKHKHDLNVRIIPCKTVDEAKALEAKLIRKHDTVDNGWNLRYED